MAIKENGTKLSRSEVLAYLYEAERNGIILRRSESSAITDKRYITSDGTEVHVRYFRGGERDSVVVYRDEGLIGEIDGRF